MWLDFISLLSPRGPCVGSIGVMSHHFPKNRKGEVRFFEAHTCPTYPTHYLPHISLPHSLGQPTKAPSIFFFISHKHNIHYSLPLSFQCLTGAHLTATSSIFSARFTRKLYRKKLRLTHLYYMR